MYAACLFDRVFNFRLDFGSLPLGISPQFSFELLTFIYLFFVHPGSFQFVFFIFTFRVEQKKHLFINIINTTSGDFKSCPFEVGAEC